MPTAVFVSRAQILDEYMYLLKYSMAYFSNTCHQCYRNYSETKLSDR